MEVFAGEDIGQAGLKHSVCGCFVRASDLRSNRATFIG